MPAIHVTERVGLAPEHWWECAWIDPLIGKVLQPFRFTATPTIHAAGTVQLKSVSADDLRIRVDAQNPFTYQFDGWEIPFDQGSGEFSMLGGDSANLAIKGTMRVKGAKVGGSKFLAPLLMRLESLGFREPLDAELRFKLDAISLRILALQIASGSHVVHLGGSLFFLGGLVDLTGDVDSGSATVRGLGTVREPIWELISPRPK